MDPAQQSSSNTTEQSTDSPIPTQAVTPAPKHRNSLHIVGLGFLVVAIFVGIVLLTIRLASPEVSTGNNINTQSNTPSNGESLSRGEVSDLSGSVTTERNLKGLTLRINQIDTCEQDAISTYIAVSSDAGVVNKNFNKSDVSVFLDGKQMTTFDFNAVGLSQPGHVALAIDSSGSMKGAALENAKAAATSFLHGLSTDDETAVLSFSTKSNLLTGMSKNKQAAISAIATIKALGDTAVYDASLDAIDQTPQCGRRAVIILSDGEDTASKSNLQAVVTRANTRNLPIFSIGLASPGFNANTLSSLASSTGGQFLTANTPAEIGNVYQTINSQLQGQFKINLKIPIQKDGTKHTLKIVSNVEGSPTSSSRQFMY